MNTERGKQMPNSRLATIAPPGRLAMLIGFPLRLTLEAMNRRSNIYRALAINPGTRVYFDAHRIYARNLRFGDPRDVALRDALCSAIPAPSGAVGKRRVA